MSKLEREECIFESRISQNSLYFSLLAGNFSGEWLALDCALRHIVFRTYFKSAQD